MEKKTDVRDGERPFTSRQAIATPQGLSHAAAISALARPPGGRHSAAFLTLSRRSMAVPSPSSIDMIRRLVGFDTTSRDSNLALIEWVKDYLAEHGVASELVYDEAKRKANLFATIGPKGSGIMLSG